MRKWLCVCIVAAAAGCAAPAASTGPEPRAPVQVSEGEVTILAAILEEEDRRVPYPAAALEHARSASPLVGTAAAVSLGRLRHAESLPVLIGLLSDPDTGVAAAGAFALGQVGDTAAVDALAALLTPEIDPGRVTVAEEAAYALGKLRSAASRAALRELLGSAELRADAPGRVARSALLAIWRFPRDADSDPIERWLSAGDPELRWRATYALVRRPDPRATPLLPDLLRDDDERVRALAARGLTGPLADSAGLGALAARRHLVGALDDDSYIVRISAIGALGTHQHPDAVRALVRLLGSAHPHEALAATASLGRLGDVGSAAAPALSARTLDEAAPVALRRAALDALRRVAPDVARRSAREAASSPLWQLRASAAAVLAATDRGAAAALTRDPDGRVAAAAVQATIQSAADSLHALRPLLLDALRSSDVGVRVAALSGFRRMADPSTLPVLLDAYAAAAAEPANDAAPAALEAIAALRSPDLEPGRAFFTRFSLPADPLLHQLAVERFGDRALAAWGDPRPIDTGRTAREYQDLVRRWVVPHLEGADHPSMIIESASGTIRLRLFSADAPLTVESFWTLAQNGYFDGQEWPRVVPNFVVQGGDPRGDTSGGPGYSLRDEISRHRYRTGTLGMALSGPDTGGSQFFITHSPQPHLDGIYAVFGEVFEGFDVTERILPGEVIRSVTVQR